MQCLVSNTLRIPLIPGMLSWGDSRRSGGAKFYLVVMAVRGVDARPSTPDKRNGKDRVPAVEGWR